MIWIRSNSRFTTSTYIILPENCTNSLITAKFQQNNTRKLIITLRITETWKSEICFNTSQRTNEWTAMVRTKNHYNYINIDKYYQWNKTKNQRWYNIYIINNTKKKKLIKPTKKETKILQQTGTRSRDTYNLT